MFEFLWGAKKKKMTLRYKTAIFDLPWSLCLKLDIGYKSFILPLSINPALSHTNILFAPHLVCWDLVITFRRIVPPLCILISQIRVQLLFYTTKHGGKAVILSFLWDSDFHSGHEDQSFLRKFTSCPAGVTYSLCSWQLMGVSPPEMELQPTSHSSVCFYSQWQKRHQIGGCGKTQQCFSEHRHWLMYAKWE